MFVIRFKKKILSSALTDVRCLFKNRLCESKECDLELASEGNVTIGDVRTVKKVEKSKAVKSVTAKNIKRFNWESVSLYGPLITSKTDNRKQVEKRVSDSLSEEAESSGFISGGEKKVRLWVQQAGYHELSQPTDFKTKVKDVLFEIRHVKRKDINVKDSATTPTVEKTDVDISSAEKFVQDEDLTQKFSQIPLLCADETKKESVINAFKIYCQQVLGVEDPCKISPASVTTVLQKSMSDESRQRLEDWEIRMIEKLGVDGFNKYKKELFEVGSLFHKQVENRLCAKRVEDLEVMDERIRGYWKSVGHVFMDVNEVQQLEAKISHSILPYRGIVDCLAKYRDVLMVIDWKTSQRPKYSLKDLYDNPLQIAAYAGALNYTESSQPQIRFGAVVVAYSNGAPAHLHLLNQQMMQNYWQLWLKRLDKYLRLSHTQPNS